MSAQHMLSPTVTVDKFISSLPSSRDAFLRDERARVFACKYFQAGNAVEIAIGTRRIVGKVLSVTPKRFEAEFPPFDGGPVRHWKQTFRRIDGRSVGNHRHINWALPVAKATSQEGGAA